MRVIQPSLMRGKLSNRAALILLVGLLAVLAFSVAAGVGSLAS